MIAATTGLPALVAAVFLAYSGYQDQFQAIRNTELGRAEALMADVDRKLVAAQIATVVLATTRSLAQGDLVRFYVRAKDFLQLDEMGDSVVLFSPTGEQLLNTAFSLGTPLPHRATMVNLSRVLETGKPQISDVYVAVPRNRLVVAIDVPVFRNGRIAYILSNAMPPPRFATLLAEQALPADRMAAIADRSGTIVARSREADKYVGHRLAAGALERVAHATAGWGPARSLGGMPFYGATVRSPTTGWIASVAVPRSVIRGLLYRSILVVVLCFGAFILLGYGAAWLIARRIEGAATALAAGAAVVGQGGMPEIPRLRVRELERTGDALSAAAAELRAVAAARQRAEAELRRSEGRFRALADTMPQLVWSALPDGGPDYFSRQWHDYTGATAAEHAGEGWLDAVHPEDRERTARQWQAAVRGEAAYDVEYRLRRFDGKYRWFKTRAAPIYDDAGQIAHWFGTCTDIQEIVEAREGSAQNREDLQRLVRERTRELELSEARFRGIFDNAAECLFDVEVTADGRFVYAAVNPQAERVCGLRTAEAVGRTPEELMGPATGAKVAAAFRHCVETGASHRYEEKMAYPNGNVLLQDVVLVPVRDRRGIITHVIGSAREIGDKGGASSRRADDSAFGTARETAVRELT